MDEVIGGNEQHNFKLMQINELRNINIESTEEFKVFEKEIDYIVNFFKSFSDLIFYNGRTISFHVELKSYYLGTDLIESSEQTLRSIKACCAIGSFSDANTLIRKLRDDLIQYLYILTVINGRKYRWEGDVDEKISNDEEAVVAWFTNTVSDLKRPIKRKLEFKNYMDILETNQQVSCVLQRYNLKKYWEVLRQRLNDYVHNNGVGFTSQNFVKRNNENLGVHLKNISIRTSYISSVFLIMLLMVESALVSSTDYMDYLNCNEEPLEGSQLYIAPFIQEFIDKKVSVIHPELKEYLKVNNIHGMKIE